MNIDIRVFEEVESTNSTLIEMAQKGAQDGRVVVAWKQTSGRGRLGRNFESPEGGIYLSMLLPFDDTMLITAKAAVAVKRAIMQETDKRTWIKWVNDIIYNGKKVAGILAQVYEKHVVLGIGINFCTPVYSFSPQVRDIATSLYPNSQSADSDQMDLVNSIVKELVELAETNDKLWIGEYRAASCVMDKEVHIFQAGQNIGSGKVTEIDNNCALHIMNNGVETVLNTGEITIREIEKKK